MNRKLKNIGFASLLCAATFSFSACGNAENSESEQVAEATYACPMDCEKGKTYSEPGQCPVCEMDLQLVTE